MATELGKAYVQIVPSAKGISGSISKELAGESTAAGKSAGLNIAGAIKGVIAAAGIGAAIKSSLDAGGALQQSFGGLDTLYGDASEAAKEYAREAAKAGISANDYAEQAVSFGASLKQAFGGDTAAAVKTANTAIMDMADNAAKMGTPLESIQQAYQGFAKGQYQLLDNLKIGYGGTKGEMQRLLADATKLSGVKYNMDNLGDVYEAIHVIQEDLGLTGVAAQEASETFSGSFAAMKAAGENLLADLALGNDITDDLNVLIGNASAFLENNLFPMISNILGSLPKLVSGLLPGLFDFGTMIANMMPGLISDVAAVLPDLVSELLSAFVRILNVTANNAEEYAQTAIDLVKSLVTAIISAAPYIAESAIALAAELGRILIETDWIQVGTDLITELSDSMTLASGEIFGSDKGFLDGLFDYITENLPIMLEKGSEILLSIVNGILSAIPSLITTAGELVSNFVGFISENMPTILSAGIDLLMGLISGIIETLPEILVTATEVIISLVNGLAENAPKMIEQGFQLLIKVATGLINAIPDLLAKLPQIFTSIVNAFSEFDWIQIGADILTGIRDGILNTVTAVVDAAREAGQKIWDSVKEFFDINSPSKLMEYAGEMIDEGLAIGITDNTGIAEKAATAMSDSIASALTDTSFSRNYTVQNRQTDSELYRLIATYLPMIADKDLVVTVGQDDSNIFKSTQRQAASFTKRTGQPAF